MLSDIGRGRSDEAMVALATRRRQRKLHTSKEGGREGHASDEAGREKQAASLLRATDVDADGVGSDVVRGTRRVPEHGSVSSVTVPTEETCHDGIDGQVPNAPRIESAVAGTSAEGTAGGEWKETEHDRARRLEVEALLRQKRAQLKLDRMSKGSEPKEVCPLCVS